MSYVPKSEAELGVDISGKESQSIFSRLMKYRLGIVPLPANLKQVLEQLQCPK